MKDKKKAIVWEIWQLGSINIGTDQNLAVLAFGLHVFNCVISNWI